MNIFRITSRHQIDGIPVDSATTQIEPDPATAVYKHCTQLGIEHVDRMTVRTLNHKENREFADMINMLNFDPLVFTDPLQEA